MKKSVPKFEDYDAKPVIGRMRGGGEEPEQDQDVLDFLNGIEVDDEDDYQHAIGANLSKRFPNAPPDEVGEALRVGRYQQSAFGYTSPLAAIAARYLREKGFTDIRSEPDDGGESDIRSEPDDGGESDISAEDLWSRAADSSEDQYWNEERANNFFRKFEIIKRDTPLDSRAKAAGLAYVQGAWDLGPLGEKELKNLSKIVFDKEGYTRFWSEYHRGDHDKALKVFVEAETDLTEKVRRLENIWYWQRNENQAEINTILTNMWQGRVLDPRARDEERQPLNKSEGS